MSHLYHSIGKYSRLSHSLDLTNNINNLQRKVTKDFDLLTTYHNANRRSQRDIIEWIYAKEENLIQEKPILGLSQMGELHSRKKKEVHHIIKPKIIIKKEPQEEKKDSILHSLLKRNHKSTKNIFNYVNDKKLKAKMKYADKLEIPYVIVIGEDEVKSDVVKIKNMKTGNEKECQIHNIAYLMRLFIDNK